MELIDTHCHLYLEEFKGEEDALIKQAKLAGINALFLPNVDISTIQDMMNLTKAYPDYTYPMMGLHPTSVKSDYSSQLYQIESWLTKEKFYAIGEIGIDLYWDKTYIKEQKIVFEEQLKWSIDLNLPVSIHTREAFSEVFDSIYKIGAEKLKGIFHSFTGTLEELAEIKKMNNFYLGINGVVTFKNSGLADVVAYSDIKNIVLETDAPYLSPVPYRGKRNEPVFIKKTAEKISEIFHLPVDEIGSLTSQNAKQLFGIS